MPLSSTEQQWHIAGPGAIGLLFHYVLKKINSSKPPIMINRSLNKGFDDYEFVSLNHHSEHQTVRWFDKKHKIRNLIITTKSHQVLDCIRSLESFLEPSANIILLHNGLGVQQEAISLWPAFHFFLGTTTEGAWKETNNKVIHAGAGETRIGNLTNTTPTWWQGSNTQRAGIRWNENIMAQLHLKVAINATINPLTILYQCQNGQLLSSPDRKSIFTALCLETQQVLLEEGYQIPELTEAVSEVAELTSANYSSSYQDWINKRQTELSSMNGYIQQLAKKHEIPTPTHDKVMAAVSLKALL